MLEVGEGGFVSIEAAEKHRQDQSVQHFQQHHDSTYQGLVDALVAFKASSLAYEAARSAAAKAATVPFTDIMARAERDADGKLREQTTTVARLEATEKLNKNKNKPKQ